MQGRRLVLLTLVMAALMSAVRRGEAHKPITSRYTFNDDVFAIVRDRCGRCHVAGGVAPMSLLSYRDAYPWAESIRDELIAGHMPPWNAEDGVGAFRNRPAITAREVDTLLTWATGGVPEGSPLHEPPAVGYRHEWAMGQPDLVLPVQPGFTLPADASEDVHAFTLATHTTEPRWVRAVDLLPGAPAIVRSATVALASAPEHLLAVWLPGDDPVPVPGGAAFRLPAGAELLVRIHYKKSYKYDGQAMADRSTVGLYFAQEPAAEARHWTVTSPPVTTEGGDRLSFSRVLDEDLQLLAIEPSPGLVNVRFQVDAVAPGGERTALIRFTVRPDWTRRYWFERPIGLARGSRIEVVAAINGADALLPPSATPLASQPVTGLPLGVGFEVASLTQATPVR